MFGQKVYAAGERTISTLSGVPAKVMSTTPVRPKAPVTLAVLAARIVDNSPFSKAAMVRTLLSSNT